MRQISTSCSQYCTLERRVRFRCDPNPITGDIVVGVEDIIACRPRGDCHASDSGLPSSASQLRRSRAAIDFYARQFPTSSKAHWGGLPALKAPNNVLILFTKVATAPATSPQTAIWHFGWHVTDSRARLEAYQGRPDVELLPLYTGDDGGAVLISSDTWPGTGGVLGLTQAQIADAKARGVQPTRAGGFAYMRGPDMPSWNTRATIRPSASTMCTCTRRIHSVRSSGIRSTSMRRCTPGAPAARP